MSFAGWLKRVPWSIVLPSLFLVGTGWLALHRAEALAGGSGALLRRQMFFSALAIFAAIAVAVPNYRVLRRWSYGLFAASNVLLLTVFFFAPVNSAHRWIPLGLVKFQPSEFAKIAFVLAMAQYLMYRENYRQLRGLVVPLMITMIPMLLILKEPDLGMAMVFLPVLFVMLFAAGARRIDLIGVVALGLLALPFLWMQMDPNQKLRIVALFDQPPPGSVPSKEAYHLYQAKQIRAMGGLWGSYWSGSLSDDPADYRLPESENDFIICVLGERFGLPGLAVVLGLFCVLVWRATVVANATLEPFGRLAAIGIATLLAIEVLINTGMSVGLMPITGLSLPFLSYGGSNLLAHAVAIGLLINIGMRPGYEVGGEPFRYIQS
jgi:cell division protein FtsW (lipid II flippase)